MYDSYHSVTELRELVNYFIQVCLKEYKLWAHSFFSGLMENSGIQENNKILLLFLLVFHWIVFISAHTATRTWIYTNLRPKIKVIRCPWLPLSAYPQDISYTMGEFACWDFIRIQVHDSNLVTALWWRAEWKRSQLTSSWLCHLPWEPVVKKA